MLRESVSIIGLAVGTSVGTAVGTSVGAAVIDNAYNFGKRLFNKMSEVDNDLEKSYERLIKQEKKLYDMRDDVLAQTKTKFVTRVRGAWISSVEEIKEKAQKLKAEFKNGKSKKRKLCELFYWSSRSSESCESREELCARMEEMCEKLHKLELRGNSEIEVMVKKLPERVITLRDPKIKDEPFYRSSVEEILSHLEGDVKIIGVWGIVGSGKTILMKILNNNKDIAEKFDIVIWVTVLRDWSYENLLWAIANRLKLDMEGITDPDEIAHHLSNEIKSKKCILLLDQVEEEDVVQCIIDMFSDKKINSKVVLATRFRDVCRAVNCDEMINMKGLSKTDAWKMFKSKVGRYIDLPGILPIAERVFKECSNWPLLIDTVARNFGKMDNVVLWEDGLKRLRSPEKKLEGIDEFMQILKFCYENLADEVTKKCFLSCANYPEDEEICIGNLLERWTAEFFNHDADEFREARGKGHAILNELFNVSFLEEGEKEDHVRMNNVLRDMALGISKNLVKSCEGLRGP